MAYFIGIILLIIVLIIFGLISRKKIYDTVDRLESWKLDIMGRNVASQLGRIKSLNLTGETQEKFEAWKERWESILTKELPDIEEYLFDAEEAADRYRFSKSRKIVNDAEKVLGSIENDIEKMLQEVDELIESEKLSRKETEELHPTLKVLRREISQNRFQYGKADSNFEEKIDGMEAEFDKYYELVDLGNYLEAEQLVINMKADIENLEIQIKAFPEVYKQCKHDLPAQLENLHSGIKEMKDGGYHVSHLGFEKETRTYQDQLLDGVRSLDDGDTSIAEPMIKDIEERIKEMYQLLEKEALAKNYLEIQVPSYQASLANFTNTFHDTKTEVEHLRQAYYFEDTDMERYLSLEKTITMLKDQLDKLSDEKENEDTAHSELREQIESGFDQIEALQKKHEEFKKRIHNLRKDELEAKEKLIEMREQLYDVKRKLKKSNIPGVPTFILGMLETASDKNSRVIMTIEKQPLDMAEVQQSLSDAKKSVEQAVEQTDLMLEQAYFTEQVIQYANRYRSRNTILSAKLAESERLFRSFEYELALEQAAKAVEEVEPGALKRIESAQTAMAE